MKQNNVLYILSNGKVAAINKKDGAIIWEIKLSAYGLNNMRHSIGQITTEDNRIYVGCTGILVCLDAKDGALIWKNELKGWGYNFISMANVNNDAAAAGTASAASVNVAVVAAT